MTKRKMPARWKFWESYSNAIATLVENEEYDKAKNFLWAIYEYSSWGIEPDFGKDTGLAMSWELIKPNLDNSVKAHAAGSAGKAKATSNKKKNDEARRVKKHAKAMERLYSDYTTDDVEDNFAAYFNDDDLPELMG